jgi:stage II sporulation protein GA (sporulation sigma-E factor processing peptidase)
VTLYADILFLINFIMDSFILWVISKCARKKISLRRALLGGLVMAGMYCLTILVEPLRRMNAVFASLIILSLGVVIALSPRNFKIFLKTLLMGYGVSFAVGGLGLALFYLTDLPYVAGYFLAEPGEALRGVPWQLPVLCIGASYVLIKLAVRAAAGVTLKRQELCPVKVFLGGDEAAFDALVDTGHSLREPVSQSPVIVAEFEYIKAFLPDRLKVLFYEKHENDFSEFLQVNPIAREREKEIFFSRLRMIPFSSIGRANGMLLGFKPDKVAVGVREYSDVIIGIYNSRLTRDGKYQGLLSPELTAEI